MKKTNILYTVWGTGYGGAERFVYNVIKRIDRGRFNVIVFSDAQKKGAMHKDFRKLGVKVIYSSYHRYKHPIKFIRQLRDVIKNEKIDIIHANDDLNMFFSLKARPKTTKTIAHSHSIKYSFSNNRLVSLLLKRMVMGYIGKHSDKKIGCSPEAGIALFGNYQYELVNNGIDLKDFTYNERTRQDLRKHFGINEETTVLLNIGRLSKEKNQVFLIDILHKYIKNHSQKVLLFIIGDGKEKERIIKRAKELQVFDKLVLLTSRNDIAKYYNLADIFILPSTYEGQGVVLIEAQQNGLPVVASDNIPKSSKLNRNFAFAKLGEGSEHWAKTIAEIEKKRIRPSQKLVKYSAEAMSIKMERIYDKTI